LNLRFFPLVTFSLLNTSFLPLGATFLHLYLILKLHNTPGVSHWTLIHWSSKGDEFFDVDVGGSILFKCLALKFSPDSLYASVLWWLSLSALETHEAVLFLAPDPVQEVKISVE